MVASGALAPCEFINVESEFAAMSVAIGASAAGARAFTATASPWLAVAVKARAPAAEAPIATDIAANSDSTLMNSHGERVPAFTIAPIASMMCVWGEMGYAQTTSGRQRATVSATAREPSICRSTDQLLFCKCDESIGSGGGGGVALTDCAREAFADRGVDGVE